MNDKTVTISEAQLADLDNGLTSLATAFGVLDTAVQAQLVAITQNVAPQLATLNPALATAIANISHLTNRMAQDAAALTAHLPAATTIDPHPDAPVVVPDAVPDVVVPVITKPPITAPDAAASAAAAADPAAPAPEPQMDKPGTPAFE